MPTKAPENNSSVAFDALPLGTKPAQDPRTAPGNVEGQAGGNAGGTASSLIDKDSAASDATRKDVPGVGNVGMIGEPYTQNIADGSAKPGERAGGKDRQGAGGVSI